MLSARAIALCRKNASEKSSASQGKGMGSAEKGARYYCIAGNSRRVRALHRLEKVMKKLTRVFCASPAHGGTLPRVTGIEAAAMGGSQRLLADLAADFVPLKLTISMPRY